MATAEPETITYPGARAPDRERWVDAYGIGIRVHEWGDEGAPVLACLHGGFDFARTYDVFAPMLADAGWRVVSWDHRGHGDSEHADLYSWEADVRDALCVLNATTTEPIPVLGHSKGGNMLLQLAEIAPHRMSAMVNIDGMPSPRRHPDVEGRERTQQLAAEIESWLGHRRRIAGLERRPGTLDELAERRGRMNPRLSKDWLRYLVGVGARHDPDGWRWKIDPALRFGGFGPWRHAWSTNALAGVPVPFLGLLGLEEEMMGWGTRPEQLRPYLPAGARLETLEGVGHFVHIEKPREVADIVCDFLREAVR